MQLIDIFDYYWMFSLGPSHSTINLHGPLGVGRDSVQAVPLQPGEDQKCE